MQKISAIVCVPGVQGGYPVVAGTRTPVRSIIVLYRDIYPGDLDAVKESLPHLSDADFEAAFEYYREHPELVDEDIQRQRDAWEQLTNSKQ